MKLLVISHKLCWPLMASGSGYGTDGGFPVQMNALAQAFDSTIVCVPVGRKAPAGITAIEGRNLAIAPLTVPRGSAIFRKALMPLWLLRNAPKLFWLTLQADGVHAPIPGDVGTIGMAFAMLLRKPLFVRHCGNWFAERTVAERFWKWLLQSCAGGRNVVLATGGTSSAPSKVNPNIQWIFSSSLSKRELDACSHIRHITPGKELRLITVGRQEEGKGTDVVIEAVSMLENAIGRVRLDVVGDGAALPRLRILAEARGLLDRIHFHGQLDHRRVLALLQESDLFCFPTASEGFPKAVLEALACGLPVVTTRVSVLPKLIGHGCGILLDCATPAALARAVADLAQDPGRYRVMSAKAVETAGQFSLEAWRDTIAALLRSKWGPLATGS